MHVDNKTCTKSSKNLKHKNIQEKTKHNNQTNKKNLIHGFLVE